MDERQDRSGAAAREAPWWSFGGWPGNWPWVATAGMAGAWVVFLLTAGRAGPGYEPVWQAVRMARQSPARPWAGVQRHIVPAGAKTEPYLLEALRSEDKTARLVALLGLAAVGEDAGFEGVFNYCVSAPPDDFQWLNAVLAAWAREPKAGRIAWGPALAPVVMVDSVSEYAYRKHPRHESYDSRFGRGWLEAQYVRKAPSRQVVRFLGDALAKEDDPRRAALAARAVMAMGPEAEALGPQLTAMLARTEDPELAEWVVRAAGAIGKPALSPMGEAACRRLEESGRPGGKAVSADLTGVLLMALEMSAPVPSDRFPQLNLIRSENPDERIWSWHQTAPDRCAKLALTLIGGPGERARSWAWETLQRCTPDPKSLTEYIVTRLNDPRPLDNGEHAVILRGLRSLKEKPAQVPAHLLPRLRTLASYADPTVRAEVCGLLGEAAWQEATSVEAITAALQAPAGTVSWDKVRLGIESGEGRLALPLLEYVLREPPTRYDLEGSTRQRRTGPDYPLLRAIAEADRPDRRPETVDSGGSSTLPPWLASVAQCNAAPAFLARVAQLVQQPDVRAARIGARLAGYLGPQAAPAVPGLLKILKDSPDTGLRHAAAWALGRIGVASPEARKALYDALPLDLLKDDRIFVVAVSRLGLPDATPPAKLLPRLLGTDRECQRLVYRMLRDTSPKAIQPLVPQLMDQLPARGRRPSTQMGPVLMAELDLKVEPAQRQGLFLCLLDRDPKVSAWAHRRLGDLGPAIGPDAESVLNGIIEQAQPRTSRTLQEFERQAQEARAAVRAALAGAKEPKP